MFRLIKDKLDKNKIRNFFFFAAVFSLIIYLSRPNDPLIEKAKIELTKNVEVINSIGKIEEISLKKYIHVSATPNTPAYKQFNFYIIGKNASALTVVKIEDNSSDKLNVSIVEVFSK